MLSRALIKSLPLLLLLAGCAGTGGTQQSASSAPDSVGAAADAQVAAIPPQVLTLWEQATAAMASGDLLDAELRFKEFLLLYPDYPGAHVNLAIIHASNGNDAAVRESVDAALALDPNNPAALNQLGMLLRRNGNFLEAEAAYLKAVTSSPDYALAHYNLGVLNELYLQRLDVALQHFKTYQELVGGDEQVEKWITDLTRRVEASQPTANVAE
jgi:tetratricopeptide (TPR) repeat protein